MTLNYEKLETEPEPKIVEIDIRQLGLRTGQVVIVRKGR